MSAHVRSIAGAFEGPPGGLNETNPVSLAGGNVAVNGNKIVVAIVNETVRTVTSVADAAGTTYTIVGTTATPGASNVDIYEGTVAANNAGQSVVVTLSGNSGDPLQVAVLEVSGLTSDQSGAQNNNTTTSAQTTHTGGTLTPPGTTDFMLVAVGRTNGGYTEDGDFTSIDTGGNVRAFFGYIVNPSGGTNISFTSDDAETTTIKSTILVGESAGSSIAAIRRYYSMMRAANG
jgi:hypothetical protein